MIEMRFKLEFFDSAKVERAVGRARRRALSKAGAFVRQSAKTSIRKRRGSAPPGKPPHSHEGSLRRLIFFGYDRSTDSVVVGPVPFRAGTAPRALEFGGPTVVQRRRRGRVVRRRTRIEPRPFMAPALERETPNLPKAFRNSVRGN